MKLSKESRRLSRELFHLTMVNGTLDHGRVRTVAAKIGESKPRQYLEILQEFKRLVRLEIEKRHGVVETAVELDPATREQLENSLRSRYGADFTADFHVTPELIGGLRIKVGSDVFDGSVRERLKLLESELARS